MTECQNCESKDLLVSYLYDEVTPDERAAIEAHLAGCSACRIEVDALTGVRAALTEWDVPVMASRFRIVSDAPAPSSRRPGWWAAAPLAAAAVLVLAVGAAVANLDVHYGADGLRVRTGWADQAPRSPQSPLLPERISTTTELSAPAAPAGVAPLPAASATAGAADGGAPWQADLARLGDELRREIAQTGARPAAVSTRTSDEELLRRVQQLIDDSELRQQRNLALRVTELSREFALQRQADLVQIQQGLGRLEGRTEEEAARSRQIMNFLRVSQQQPK